MLDDAEKFLRAALEKQPDDPEIYFRLADVMLGRGRISEALPLVSEAVSLAPENHELRFQFGLLLIRVEKGQDAARQFELYLDAEPRSADGFYQLGEAHALSGHHRQAAEAYSRALDLNPEFKAAQRALETSWEKMHAPATETPAEQDHGKPLTQIP
jgi:predicted Zn-dependent protease